MKRQKNQDEGKFCIRECMRVFIPAGNDQVKVYCPSCDRTLRILDKKKNLDFKDIE